MRVSWTRENERGDLSGRLKTARTLS